MGKPGKPYLQARCTANSRVAGESGRTLSGRLAATEPGLIVIALKSMGCVFFSSLRAAVGPPVVEFMPAAAGIFHSGMEIRTLCATFAADFKGADWPFYGSRL